MTGDITRVTFKQDKHYQSVRQQQGRVQLDAEWNEQADIVAYLREAEGSDVIGPCGVPEGNAGFAIGLSDAGLNLTLGQGHAYVDGILCENDAANALLTSQDDLPGLTQAAGQPISLSAVLTPFSSDQLTFDFPFQAGIYLAYLDVWERHISPLEDPAIREVALGGPDTTTRTKTVWQVKALRVGKPNELLDCTSNPARWTTITAPSSGVLAARAKQNAPQATPCTIVPDANFRGQENHLYRVEIHDGGSPGTASYKWSRDNGATAAKITTMSGNQITISNPGRDSETGFASAQWVEVTDDLHELWGVPGTLVAVSKLEGLVLTVDPTKTFGISALVAASFPLNPKVRRWDGAAALAPPDPSTNDGFIQLEDGVQVVFANVPYKSGDYWLIPARVATGDIEWPLDAANQPAVQSPHGRQHHYCRLQLLQFDGQKFALQPNADCRLPFPPLTHITASDVVFDDTHCQLPGVKTVQQALDALCARGGDCCTVTITEATGWEALIAAVPDGTDVNICFPIGRFSTQSAIVVKNKANVRVSGCGLGTRITSAAESVFQFVDCQSVDVRDLHAESAGSAPQQLNGTLSFSNCPIITVEETRLKCGGAIKRAVTCITVLNTDELTRSSRPAVRIRHNDLEVGHLQTGILLVNTDRAQVEDNTIRASNDIIKPETLLADRDYRIALRNLLVAQASITGKRPANANAILSFEDWTVYFKTDRTLSTEWPNIIKPKPPTNVSTARSLLYYLKESVDRILRDPNSPQVTPTIKGWLANVFKQTPAIAAAGIMIGGRSANEARILNNTISGVLQGVHLGVSHKERKPATPDPDSGGGVTIRGNTISLVLAISALDERYGIYVGNCNSLIIADNYVQGQFVASRPANPPSGTFSSAEPSILTDLAVEGIRVYGYEGRLMIVRQNHLVGVSWAIHVQLKQLTNTGQQNSQWLVANNMFPNAPIGVRVLPQALNTAVMQVANFA